MSHNSQPTIQALRGMKDVLPPESALWNHVESTLRSVFDRYGYAEVRTPLVEFEELFNRSIGDGTDIVQKEMYAFCDRKERRLVLRPEATASIVRAYIEHKCHKQQEYVKWYYMGPMFRAERPQAGRQRQFSQAGVEVIGLMSPYADAEVMILGMHMLRELGVSEACLHINTLGCSADRDRMAVALAGILRAHTQTLCADCCDRLDRNVLRVLDCKNPTCRAIIDTLPDFSEWICQECRDHFSQVQQLLNQAGVNATVSPHLVRGLDYYTRTVFEVTSSCLGSQDALLAGGRYDTLIESLGGPQKGAVGFAMGLERLLLVLAAGNASDEGVSPQGVFVATVDENAFPAAFSVLDMLRNAGCPSIMEYIPRSLKSQMRTAHKMESAFVVIVSDDVSGSVTVKNMTTSEQRDIQKKELTAVIKQQMKG